MKPSTSNGEPISGRYLALVREEAGLSQADLAERIASSSADVSRIESGERTLAKEEIDAFLQAIGTAKARQLGGYLSQDWDETERPDFDHPNREHLWMVNIALKKLRQLKSNPNLINVFVRQVDFYEQELDRNAAFLRCRENRIAFVGSIGVGKSTAICKLVGLVKPNESKLTKETVLETGGGRTTLCEVHITAGTQYSLRIAPRGDENIRRDVEDFAEYLIQRMGDGPSDGQAAKEDDREKLGISAEVIRAIRNMSGLVVSHGKAGENGKTSQADPAQELAVRHSNVEKLTDEILSRMKLPMRNQKEESYVDDGKGSPLEWLQKIFKDVNNGRRPEFTIPERIDVVLPHPVLFYQQLSLTVLDTKGIDQTAERQDLESLFDDPRTLVVLCSEFSAAPEMAIQGLLRRAKELKARNIEKKSLVLVLPRPDQALAVKNDEGDEAESDGDGYRLKQVHIEQTLLQLGLPDLPVHFYNAGQEAAGPVRDELIANIVRIRKLYGDEIEKLSKGVDDLISNQEDLQVQKVFREVERRLLTWIKANRELSWDHDRIRMSLVRAIEGTRYASRIRATVKRTGDWPELNYYHHLGQGARRLAIERMGGKVEEFKITVKNALDDEGLAPARMFLSRVLERLDLALNESYLKIQEFARDKFRMEFQRNQAFWQECRDLWGRGTGYRGKIRDMTDEQLASNLEDAHLAVRLLVMDEWKKIVSLLEEMLEEREGPFAGEVTAWLERKAVRDLCSVP